MANKVKTYVIKRLDGGKEDIIRTISRDYGVRTHSVNMRVNFSYGGEAEIEFFVDGYSRSVCFMTKEGRMKFIPKMSYNMYYGKLEEEETEESEEQKALKNLVEEVKQLREELNKTEEKTVEAVKETAITKK